jgi:hypothetical protein
MSTVQTDSKGTDKNTLSWLRYGAEILTIFFALAVITGRIYTLNYWNVFGIFRELTDTSFINYAIVSPNTAVASMFLAAGTVAMLAFFRGQPYDLIGDKNPTVSYMLGWIAFWAGVFVMGLVTKVDLSSWPDGTIGLIFGLSYFFVIGGQTVWMQAMLKRQTELSNLDKALFGWLKKIPIMVIQVTMVVLLISGSLGAIFDTAKQFGANEAKMTYNTRPIVTLQLDSPTGLEPFHVTTNPNGATLTGVRIITETGDFLYIAGITQTTPQQLYVRAVPISRVKAIQYEMAVPPIGK